VDYFAIHLKKLKTKAGLKRFDEVKALVFTLIIVLLIAYFFVSPKRYYGIFGNWVRYQSYKEHLVGTSGYPVFLNKAGLVDSGTERIGRAMVPSRQSRQIKRIVKYLMENTREDEPVFCFPELALYNFLTDRPAVSRFYIATFAWTAPEWREEILRQLDREWPRVIIYDTRLSALAKSINRSEELLPEVRKYITENYHVIRKIGEIHIYERNI
jgi:hypothetical protein